VYGVVAVAGVQLGIAIILAKCKKDVSASQALLCLAYLKNDWVSPVHFGGRPLPVWVAGPSAGRS